MLGLTSFFNDFSNEMILAAFPAFFTSVLKAGAASLGLVEGIADGFSNILKIYSGRLSDKIQKRRIFIFIGYGLSVIIRPFYMLVGSVGGVLGLRITDRIGKGLREAPRDVIISASADEGGMGRAFGYHRTMDTLGGIMGPLAAYFILLYWPIETGTKGFTVIFISAFILGLCAVTTIFFVKEIAGGKNEKGEKILSLKAWLQLPTNVRIYLLAIFLLSMGTLPSAVLLLQTTSIGLLIANIPLFYMFHGLSYTAFSYYFGAKSDKVSIAKVLIFGYLVLLLSYLIVGLASSFLVLAVAFVVMGLFAAATDSTQRAWIGRQVEFHHRGAAYGLFQAAVGFGAMIAGIVGGWLWQVYSPTAALMAGAITVIVGIIVLLVSVARARC